MDLSDVMDAVANRLDTIAGLRVVAYPDGQVNPPCAVVAMPSDISFDATYARGSDRLTLPVVVLVSGTVPRMARDAMAAYCDGSGSSSIKAVVESGSYTAFDSVRVTGIQFDAYTYGGVEYPAAIFDLDIYGHGS